MGLVAFGISAFLTVAFACAFFGAALAARAVTWRRPPGRRGAHPILPLGLLAVLYAILVNGLIDQVLGRPVMRVPPDRLRAPLLVAVAGIGVGAAIVARMGLARQVLAAASVATALTAFAVPFLGRSTSLLYQMPGLMAAFVPAGLGMILGGALAWARLRQRAALRSLPRPRAATEAPAPTPTDPS